MSKQSETIRSIDEGKQSKINEAGNALINDVSEQKLQFFQALPVELQDGRNYQQWSNDNPTSRAVWLKAAESNGEMQNVLKEHALMILYEQDSSTDTRVLRERLLFVPRGRVGDVMENVRESSAQTIKLGYPEEDPNETWENAGDSQKKEGTRRMRELLHTLQEQGVEHGGFEDGGSFCVSDEKGGRRDTLNQLVARQLSEIIVNINDGVMQTVRSPDNSAAAERLEEIMKDGREEFGIINVDFDLAALGPDGSNIVPQYTVTNQEGSDKPVVVNNYLNASYPIPTVGISSGNELRDIDAIRRLEKLLNKMETLISNER